MSLLRCSSVKRGFAATDVGRGGHEEKLRAGTDDSEWRRLLNRRLLRTVDLLVPELDVTTGGRVVSTVAPDVDVAREWVVVVFVTKTSMSRWATGGDEMVGELEPQLTAWRTERGTKTGSYKLHGPHDPRQFYPSLSRRNVILNSRQECFKSSVRRRRGSTRKSI